MNIGSYEKCDEKSCGAVIYRVADTLEYLLIKSLQNGHYGFPKGHMEAGESELETAYREVKEEIGQTVVIEKGFRKSIEYALDSKRKKQVVYFVGQVDDETIRIQEEEIASYKWLTYLEAMDLITYESNKEVLISANHYLRGEKNV